MSSKKTIHFIITGGTIDSYYRGEEDTAKPRQHSVLPRFFSEIVKLNDIEVRTTEVCMKDSRALSIDDMGKVASMIESNPERIFIVTHGTYTMPDTGRFLQSKLNRKNATVVLTGAMIPLEGFSPTDAGFNLGFAVAKALELPSGVYIAMNGSILDPSKTIKVLSEGRFRGFGEEESGFSK